MIDLYSWATPNGHKVHIMLEECELPYRVHGINIGAGDQFKPDFLKISPNNKIPAIVDTDAFGGKPQSVFESGAILIYLAEKTGQFLAPSGPARIAAWEPEIERTIEQLVAAMPEDSGFDFVNAFAVPLTLQMICLILGLPYSDAGFIKAFTHAFTTLYVTGGRRSSGVFVNSSCSCSRMRSTSPGSVTQTRPAPRRL